MHEQLDHVQIQALENDFILPVIIRQMMQGLEPLDRVAEFTMHDILGELEPDTALLCIALSARKIAHHCAHMPVAPFLEKETDRQIARYGPLWLIHAQDADRLDDQKIFALLSHIPDDLQTLGKMIRHMRAHIGNGERVPGVLCEILSIQAETFKGRAMSILRASIIRQNIDDVMESLSETGRDSGNIVPFPVTKTLQPALP